jgi:type IV pilus assembly protein PilX
MNPSHASHPAPRPGAPFGPGRTQRGTALVVALLFLVLLSLLGMSSMSATTLEEKMSTNSQDQNAAMQAAEAALRDAQADLQNTNTTNRVVAVTNFNATCSQALCAECAQSLCTQPAPAANALNNPLASAFLGQFTGLVTGAFSTLAQQPRYVIELLTALPPQTPTPPAGQAVRNFRITAKGYGHNANTVVVLQTVYQMTL